MLGARRLFWPVLGSHGMAEDAPARTLPVPAHLVFWATTLATAIAAMARSAYLFTTAIYEQSDQALNSLLVLNAEHADQFVGNYSRVGFHHPGPAFLYVLAAGQALFHDALPITPTAYNGQLLGSLVLSSVLLGLAVLTIYRCSRSVAASAVSAAIIFAFATHRLMLGDVWFPYLYMAPYALMLVAGAALAAGFTAELPSFVLAAGFLIHGHVSFAMFVVVTSSAVAAGWVARRRAMWRDELASHRNAVLGGLALLVAFMLPMIAELVLRFPGPWPAYWHYLHQRQPPRGATDVVRFIGWYWSGAQAPIVLVAAVVACALMVIDRRRWLGHLYAMLALQSLLFVAYIARGVDYLSPLGRYVGFFYLTVPLLLATGAAAYLTIWVEQRIRAGHRRLLPVAAVATAVAVIAGEAAATRNVRDTFVGGIEYPRLVAAIASAPARQGRTVAFDFLHDRWPQAAAIGIAAQRRHLPWCISNPRWTNLFTANYVCDSRTPQWTLAIFTSADTPAGATVIWSGGGITIIERDPHAPLLHASA